MELNSDNLLFLLFTFIKKKNKTIQRIYKNVYTNALSGPDQLH